MDDAQAVRCLKQGEIIGLEFLVSRYQVKAIRTAFLITRDESTAEDVVQEVFVRIFQRIHHFDESRAFEPYLMRSVVNSALNMIQKESKWESFPSNEDGTIESLLLQAPSVEDEVALTQFKRDLQAALEKLPLRQRAAIVQRYYLDMSEKEMADALESAPGTVKWLLNEARTRLRALLEALRSAE
jgi:RNA polymerase sigma-70 factor (ECF subfamily)